MNSVYHASFKFVTLYHASSSVFCHVLVLVNAVYHSNHVSSLRAGVGLLHGQEHVMWHMRRRMHVMRNCTPHMYHPPHMHPPPHVTSVSVTGCTPSETETETENE